MKVGLCPEHDSHQPLVEYNRPLITTVELMSATERQDHRQTGHWFALDLELNWKLLQSHRHCLSLSKRRVQHARRPPGTACIPPRAAGPLPSHASPALGHWPPWHYTPTVYSLMKQVGKGITGGSNNSLASLAWDGVSQHG